MSHSLTGLNSDNTSDYNPVEQILERFKQAWEKGLRPEIADFWPADDADPVALLSALVRIDLVHRVQAGESARLDEYLQDFPELAANHDATLALIGAEFEARREREPSLTTEEFTQRFPEFRDELTDQIGNAALPLTMAGAPVPLSSQFAGPPGTLSEKSTSTKTRGANKHWPSVEGYEILGELGHGGMGVVYKARHVGLHRTVALKMILTAGQAGEDEIARFLTEAEAVARLHHPNVVQIYDIGENNGLPYFSLEYCSGGSLSSRLGAEPQPPRRAAKLVEALARAMYAAHQVGIVHRDLKPANVLLAPPSDHGADEAAGRMDLDQLVPKITDFGLAKKLDDPGMTRAGAIMGTPSYMAPEQAEGRSNAIGPATDVYALAAILYELTTGRAPFKGPTSWDTMEQVRTQAPVPPRQLQPKLPRDLETICLKGLRKEPGQRYASAHALADDLRCWLDGQPIKARPVSTWERGWKWAQRRPAVAALLVVAVLAGCTSVAALALYARNQSQQAHIAKQELKRNQQQEEVRAHSERTLLQAQQYEAAGNWADAYTELTKAQESLDAVPELAADELRAEVRDRLAVAGEHLTEEGERRKAQKRLQDFQAPYDNALFYEMAFTGLGASADRDKTRAAARSALAAYGLDADAPSPILEHDKALLDPAEYTRLVNDCYELLLVWAEAEASAGPGRAPAETALSLLARAENLGKAHNIDTRTYHIRKEHYLAQSEGRQFDPTRVDQTAPAKPTQALDWFLEGMDQYRVGRYDEADAACRQVLRLPGKRFWPYYVLALCRLREGRWIDAKAELTICANERPDFVWPKLLRGFAASELGYQEGKGKAADSQSQSAAEYKAAEEDFNSALQQDADPLVQFVGLTNRGALNVRRRRWEDAARDLRAAVKMNPQGFPAYVNLAKALQGEGKSQEAVATLDQAVQLAPNLAGLYEARAELQLTLRRRPAARADFEQAIAHTPKNANPKQLVQDLVEVGQLYNREGDYAAALARFDRALALKPDYLLTQRYRAETLLALNREADAAKALDEYLKETPEAPADVYQARALLFADAGQSPAAVEMYTLALRQNPGDNLTRSYRGWTYLLTDAVRLALDDFERCLRNEPDNAEALAGRSNARIRLKQLDGALNDARASEQSAEKNGPLKDRLLYSLARVYAQAVSQLGADARPAAELDRRTAARRLAQYREKALELLSRAMEALPKERRAAFWKNRVEVDPAFAALREADPYSRLAGLYAGANP